LFYSGAALLSSNAVRSLAIVVAGLCVVAPGIAQADPTAEELRASGEQLAKDGRYSEAIEAFKASNKLAHRATNYCLIGLAYTRRELWSQAEVMIDLCKAKATSQDPLPEWLPVLEHTLADRLANVEVAPVEIVVQPAGVAATIAVSSFAPDEVFEPRTIHLSPGRHVIVVSAANYPEAQRTIEVTGRTPQRVVVDLTPPAAPKPPAVVVHQDSEPHSKLPYVVIGAGATLVVVGAIVHATAFNTAANNLQVAHDTGNTQLYDEWSPKFDSRRTGVIALYGVGALTIGAGVVLNLTVFKHSRSPVEISAVPTTGGGMVSLGWTR
jgi:hypothetical protein